MTKLEKTLDIIMQYNLSHADYEWYKSHEYIMRAIAANDFSVLQQYTANQQNAIRNIYTTWIHALELTQQLDEGLKYNRAKRSY